MLVLQLQRQNWEIGDQHFVIVVVYCMYSKYYDEGVKNDREIRETNVVSISDHEICLACQ
jgi:hypothetical protein